MSVMQSVVKESILYAGLIIGMIPVEKLCLPQVFRNHHQKNFCEAKIQFMYWYWHDYFSTSEKQETYVTAVMVFTQFRLQSATDPTIRQLFGCFEVILPMRYPTLSCILSVLRREESISMIWEDFYVINNEWKLIYFSDSSDVSIAAWINFPLWTRFFSGLDHLFL